VSSGVLLAAALAACGSTVQQAGVGETAGTAGGGDELSAGGTAAPDATGLEPGGTGGSAAGSLPATAGGSGGTASTGGAGTVAGTRATNGGAASGTGPGGKAAATATGPSGPGVTDTTIVLGIEDDSGNDQRLQGAGIKGASVGSEAARQKHLIDQVNAAGGIGGRKLVPLVYTYDVNSTDPPGERAKECAFFTQDHKVFAFMGGSPYDDYRGCMARAGVAVIGDLTNFDDTTLRQFPYTYPFEGMSVTRQQEVLVAGLQAQGFLSGSHVYGILYGQSPVYQRARDALVAALGRRGISVAPSHQYGIRLTSTQDASTDAQAAELRFKTDGVDRVVFAVNQPLALGVFMINASSQQYYPGYGVSSFDSPALVEGNVADKKQFAQVHGVGWLPFGDDVDRKPPYSAGAQACLDDFNRAGITAQSNGERSQQLADCDLYDFLRNALLATGPRITPDTFRAGVASSKGFPARETFSVDTSRRQDGIAAVAPLGWDGSALVYTGGPQATG
jgi:hypothetical protein